MSLNRSYDQIDHVLACYSKDTKPDHTENHDRDLFTCMPPPSLNGEMLSDDLVEFLNEMVDNLRNIDIQKLYDMSDHALAFETFEDHFMSCIGKQLKRIQEYAPNARCCDLHIDPDSLRSKYANLMWKVDFVAYTIAADQNLISEKPIINMNRYFAAMHITWLGDRYALISKFSPIMQDVDEM